MAAILRLSEIKSVWFQKMQRHRKQKENQWVEMSSKVMRSTSICMSKEPEEELKEARPETDLKLHDLGVQMPLELQGQLR